MSDMSTDPEVNACAAILAALESLDFLARKRVLDWAAARTAADEALYDAALPKPSELAP